MSSNSSRDAIPPGAASSRVPRVLRILAPAVLILRFFSAPGPAGASATLPEMARLEAAERLDRIQVDRLARWYGKLGLTREAAEFLERRIRAGDLSRDEAAPIFGAIVRDPSRRGDADVLLPACDVAMRNGARTSAILYSCSNALRLKGRAAEGLALLSRIGPADPWFPYARYAIGQIAVEAGDVTSALATFHDLKGGTAAAGEGDTLAARAALAELNLLLLTGQSRVSSPVNSSAGPSDDFRSARGRVVQGIRVGEAAEGRGEIEEAVRAYRRSMEEANAILSAPLPSIAGTAVQMKGPSETFRLLLAAHETADRNIAQAAAAGFSPYSGEIRDLLADLLCLDFVLRNAGNSLAPLPTSLRIPFLSPERRDRIFLAIERTSLGGMEPDRLLEKSGEALEVLGNLAHPILRFRSLADLERYQAELEALADRVGRSREVLIASLESTGENELLPMLRGVDAYLRDLDALRAAWDERGEMVRRRFDIFPKAGNGKADGEAAVAAAREGLVFHGESMVDLRRLARDLDERARSLARDREAEDFRNLQALAARRYVEALLRVARMVEENRPEDWRPRFWGALGEGAAVVEREVFNQASRAEFAVRIGLLAVRSLPRQERFPQKAVRGPEEDLIRKILRMLEVGPPDAGGDRRALLVSSLLRWRIGDPGAAVPARAFVTKFPGSPMAGHLALRLGHEALRARRWKDAEDTYRDAAGRGPAEVAATAHFMLGWLAYKNDDAARALRELAVSLAEPAAATPESAAFEEDVYSLAVRCFLRPSSNRPEAYAPVRDRTPAGKRILAGLAEAESRRGRLDRAAELYAEIARFYVDDADSPAYEVKSVEALIHAGMEREALSQAFALARRFERGFSAADVRGEGQQRTRKALARLLRDLAQRRFAEGERSGRSGPMSDAAAAIKNYFELAGASSPGAYPEMRLLWAVSSLRSGDWSGGIHLLEEILAGGAPQAIGERAALLHGDAVIAGYEGKEISAPKVESSLLYLLRHHPGGEATVLGVRGAAAFLGAGDWTHAARAAGAVEASGTAAPAVRDEARLLRARALLFLGEFAAARAKAEEVLGEAPGARPSDARTHARDLVLLATGKEADAKVAAGDRVGAAALLEESAARFPDQPDAADRVLDAMSYYRIGADPEGAVRTGLAFLRLFPGRIECLDVAATVGPLLEERGKGAQAAMLYARVSELFPRDGQAPRLLFLAARLAEKEGDRDGAERWYTAYSRRYSEPRWVAAYAILSAGLLAWRDGNSRAIGVIETGLRLARPRSGEEDPPDLHERAGKARLALGEYWAGKFREIPLVDPLEKNLARKQQCFRKSVAAYEEAAGGSAPLDVRLEASRSSADLFVEFGRAIMDSERPGGMDAGERELYETALAARFRKYVERALADYASVIDRLKQDGMPAALAEPFRMRLDTVSRLLRLPPEARVR